MASTEMMHGAKVLTWSGGLLERLGISEGDEATPDVEPELVTAIDDVTWHRVRDMRGAKLAILEAAEVEGKVGVDRVLAELLSRAPPGYAARYLDGRITWIRT